MKPADLTGHHIGRHITATTRNGNTVQGTLDRVRHAATGTYIEFLGVNGVYQLDMNTDVFLEDN